MPMFIGVHKNLAYTDETQMQEGWTSYKEAATKRGLKPIRVHYNTSAGVAFCETQAQTADEVRAAHEDIGAIPDEIVEVKTSE